MDGDAVITYRLPEGSEHANKVYKKIMKIVSALSGINGFDDFYTVFKLLRPSEKYDIIEVVYKNPSVDSDGIFINFKKKKGMQESETGAEEEVSKEME